MRLVQAGRSAAQQDRNLATPVNNHALLSVLVVMIVTQNAARDESACDDSARDADAAVRQLYACHAVALHGYVARFCPDQASVDDIVQETFIRAWRHLPRLCADDRPVRPWLFRVARNLLIDADRAARSRPATVQVQPPEEGGDDTGLNQILDRQLVTGALSRLSPAHRAVLVEIFYQGDSVARAARQLGIPHGTARSRLHYALQALREQLAANEAAEC
jgi:RNA polymerase sigma-70 factor (ECF subfamily)